MRERTVCRFCHLEGGLRQSSGGERKPFAISGSSPHYAPDRPFRLEHILLDVSIDPKAKTLRGKTTQKVRVVSPHQKTIRLDQVGLQIQEATVNGERVEFSVYGNELILNLRQSFSAGQQLEFTVQYQVQDPKRGMYFTGPDRAHPQKPYQVWTQGQDEDNRYWFPSFDYPNQKATSEVVVRVPQGYTAISNGGLLSKREVGHEVQFHYKLNTPHVTYLITLAVGQFAEWSEKGPRGLPVQYFVAPGKEEDGRRAFGNTPHMIDVFEKKTGIEYPYEKYSQVAVQDFIFGGMENTSATTQTDLTLHDQRAHLDFSSEPLVSHELAHQWFGDLVTCRDWSHGWLNEGFATFLERVWVESDPGPNGGFEEAKYYSYQDLKEYLDEDKGRYRRPIVCNTYIEPIDLFDRHLYQKGGLVLNLIRHVLGEDLFWQSVQFYLKRHRGQNVETLDLVRAIEETSGKNLRRFFDEWVFQAGHPEFEVSYQWHEDTKLNEWVIEQKQTQGKPELVQDRVSTPVFHVPVVLEMRLSHGEVIRHTIETSEIRERVFIPTASKPLMVRFDPHSFIPKTLKFPRPKEMLLYQLEKDSDCMGRIEAAKELSKIMDGEVLIALAHTLQKDPFWGVQAEVAQVLSEVRREAARDALISGLSVKHPKARRAIVAALGSFKDPQATDALYRFTQGDPSYYVEAEGVQAWTKAQLRPGQVASAMEVERLEATLLDQLKKESYREVIRSAAIVSLAEIPGVEKGDRPKAFQAIVDWSQRGRPLDARMASVRALGNILKKAQVSERVKVLRILSDLAEEDQFRLRMQLVQSLTDAGFSEGIPILSRIRATDADGRVRRLAQEGIDTLMTSGGVPDTVAQLKSALEKLEEDYRKLRSLVEERPFRPSSLETRH